ncbi:MAG TPA: methyltransferase domain-containing protein [Candidatus Acidoferrales bacterium]|nr:methyltransferase domain-containing protein [Candidatus Acidoferrales bacterium]
MINERLRPARLLRGSGIEIGALHRPLPLPLRARVTYVDRMPVEKLRQHYAELADLDLTAVDVIGSAEDLSAFGSGSLDFVIANHLIEHLEDPIVGLKEFHRVLHARGLLFMCVPDARVTFDRLRPLTTVDHLLAEHRGGRPAVAANRRSHYEDWVANVECSGVLGDLHRPDTAAGPEGLVKKLLDMDYSIHFHCWHADTFLDFFRIACREEHLDFEVLDAVDTTGNGRDELILLAGKRPSAFQRMRAKGWRATLKTTPIGPALVRARHLVSR